MQINDEIAEIQALIADSVPVLQIYIFGSYADGTHDSDSDYDFYVVIPDDSMRPLDATRKISMALRSVRKRPIDVLAGSESRFNKFKNIYSIEKEVLDKGVKLYG
ncbi:MAG: nucleotidyltransferase domain-containing protein [Oscillospiraceae bacterium]|nr:nucleotidyltransferase domain-containing protein [Oscillospiraceae bacterium]